MSAFGTKRTSESTQLMSAIAGKADIFLDSACISRAKTKQVNEDKSGAVSAFVGFSDDCGFFAFLVVILFVVFILVIIVVWVFRRQAQRSDKARVNCNRPVNAAAR